MRLSVVLLLIPLLSGCETIKQGFKDITSPREQEAPPPAARKPEPSRSEGLLAAGVARYEEGNYVQAQRLLQSSLAEGLPTRASQARAHKYLAFIYCITDRTPQCRQEFNNAITADPKFTLTSAEAGHPQWGPVFRSVRSSR